MTSVAQYFKSTSVLAKALKGFAPRPAQTEMATAIAATLKAKSQLVVEAETGTGKTYAYLVPILKSKGSAIISTGTKALQEQLFHRDLPALRDAIAPQKQVSLLKGRSNYLCLHRLAQSQAHASELSTTVQRQVVEVKRWAARTEDGDVGGLNALPEDAEVLPHVTSTVDNCLGRDCPDYDDCYLVKARKSALEADIVVVNHHLFFADMALKDVGFGELIPHVDALVFDEAHQLPDIASQYFGESVGSRQLQELAQEAKVLYLTEVKDLRQLDKAADKLLGSLRDWRLAFPVDPQRGNWRQAQQQPQVAAAIALVSEALTFFTEVVKGAIGRNQDLDTVYERCVQSLHTWEMLQETQRTGFSFWFETTPRQVTLHQTPLQVADKFGSYVANSEASWVFTSATLAIGDDFSHFTRLLGLEQAATLCLPSPFKFSQQATLCVPRYLPQPHEVGMLEHLIQVTTQVLDVNKRGGTFVLFTSHRMLQRVAERLETLTDRPLFVQGSTNKRELLADFIAAGNGVLLGTSSFWEGVDVRGDALTCVIIDKLPFGSPDDPLLQARIEDCRLRGAEPFTQVQLPPAVIALKQGAGRLIRDSSDRGVLIVCDQRLVTKPYGQLFLASLPPLKRTRNLTQALNFLAEINGETPA
ncbi:putative ATP-dependent helicase DinG [Pseudidiomarina piscicola]|uniref:DNA 5'-3' helicase n=1 Tax=Pseudidiomarina piscicola TaxID=2614830 RepID=A0A6S6WL61_9GAMM|nr:ATP-dependent DNA helicase [Pseudidiomarina piscicola]CAB0149693.1 putative ATP-dependent helicase DinG [Pseudidiomarina piscicola]VZT39142.1 putative ATP-dependent helicase DinG [Pseudomonas aeruginosa]